MARTALASAIPLMFLLTVGVAAVDFGRYWDDEAMFAKVRAALASPPTLLPHAYDYPGVTFLMALAAVAPEAWRDPQLRRVVPDTSALDAFTRTEAYRLRTRRVFVAMSSLAVVWIAGLSVAIGATPAEAFLAAAFFASSWEVGYHLRWIAPDGVTAMFVAASVMCAAAALRAPQHGRTGWLRSSAVLAGLATASKYSAWPVVMTVAIAAWLAADDAHSVGQRLSVAGALAAIAVAVFFVASPGTLLQPTLAVGQMRAQVLHYGSNGHGIYTVDRGFDHLQKMLTYDALVLPSPYALIGAALSAAAIVGAVALVRESPRTAVVVLSFPVLFTAYFTLQRTMIVRNLLVVAPFGCVLAARGVQALWQRVNRRQAVARPLLAAAVGIALALNVSYQIGAAQSVRARESQPSLSQFRAWLSVQPGGSVRTARRLAFDAPGDAASASSTASTVALYALDAVHAGVRPNERGTFARVFGPRDVNLDYYPDWTGDEHIVLLSQLQAVRFGVR